MHAETARSEIVAFYVDPNRERARHVAQECAALARRAGFGIALCRDHNPLLDIATTGADVANADILITIGGDGTFLKGARIAAEFDIPILGINTGRLGFLTELDAEDALGEYLPLLFSSRAFAIERRLALQARVNDGEWRFALNEIAVRRSSHARMAPFWLALDGEEIAHIPCDGIIVATPTGSTAYFLSAGGPIIAPDVEAIGVVALLPHTFFARPIVVSPNAVVTIRCDDELRLATFDTDGEHIHDVRSGDRIDVARYPVPMRFVRIRPRTFFARLEDKLQWGVPIKSER
jgi:NAD+ kinase